MITALLVRGLVAGLVAGLLAFAAARTYGEPPVDRAIAFEEAMADAAHGASEPPLVSRRTQAGIGLLTAVIVYGVALGGLFALAFAATYGRLGALGPRAAAALLALAGFLVFVAVPAIKYPPNPPAVGDPATIGRRTALYFIMLAISLASAVVATGAAARLVRRFGAWNGGGAALLAFVLAIGVADYALPTVDEVPARFSADVLWQFRVVSIGVQAVLWAALGLGFGIAADRFLSRAGGHERARAALD